MPGKLPIVIMLFSAQGRIQPGGGGGHRGMCPPAVTPSMGIYILFYNALITF